MAIVVQGNTPTGETDMTQDAAVAKWVAMDWMQRLSIMDQVGYVKSPTKRYRLCIAHIQATA